MRIFEVAYTWWYLTSSAALTDFDRHRPLFHLTPAIGHNNDPTGMFYDPLHGRYHIFVDWNAHVPSIGGSTWYHFTSKDLVSWERVGVDPVFHIAGMSGGGVIGPDGVPTLITVSAHGLKPSIAVPVNRSDPYLTQWKQTPVDSFTDVYTPLELPGAWDPSIVHEMNEIGERWRVTFGSCIMVGNRTRPQLHPYCDGKQIDGMPAIVSYVSQDFRHWKYLGEPWRHPSNKWLIPGTSKYVKVPRTECPYQWQQDQNLSILKVSIFSPDVIVRGAFLRLGDFLFVGTTSPSNGSSFVASNATHAGVLVDYGDFYASGVLADTRTNVTRQLLFGFITNEYNLARAVKPSFDCALSLPRVMGLTTSAVGDVVPTWEVAPEIVGLRMDHPTVIRNLILAPREALQLKLPPGATGDMLELRLNISCGSLRSIDGPVGFSVRATESGISAQTEQTLIHYSSSIGLEVNTTSLDPNAYNTYYVAPPVDALGNHIHSVRVFVDRSVIEAHVDGRVSITSRAYPLSLNANQTYVINQAFNSVAIDSIEVWGIKSIWAFDQRMKESIEPKQDINLAFV